MPEPKDPVVDAPDGADARVASGDPGVRRDDGSGVADAHHGGDPGAGESGDPGVRDDEETTNPRRQDGGEPRRATDGADVPPVTWRELARDFVKPGRAQVVFAAILLVCGLAVAMQVRTQAQQTDYSSLRHADLVRLLDDVNAESRRLEGEIAELEQTQRQLQGGVDRERVARDEAQRRLDVLSILGGTAPAEGPGVRIVIHAPQQRLTGELLLNTIEELRDAGAEVIAINGSIRVVASTWFGTGGSGGVLVDGRPVTTPLTLDVIGDAHALTEAVRFSGGLVSEVQDPKIGGTVSVTSHDVITVTAVTQPSANRFAKPA